MKLGQIDLNKHFNIKQIKTYCIAGEESYDVRQLREEFGLGKKGDFL